MPQLRGELGLQLATLTYSYGEQEQSCSPIRCDRERFLHLHHLRDLAPVGRAYTINPKEDLRPVCPNRHAMFHKSKPAYSIAGLRELMAAQRD